MNCQDFEMLLADALGGELADADRPALEAHLAECSRCRDEHRSANDILEKMRAIPGPSRDLETGAVRAQGLQASAWRKLGPVLRYAATIVVAFGAGYLARGTQATAPDGPPGGRGAIVARDDDSAGQAARNSFEAALSGAYRTQPRGSDLAKCMSALFRARG